MKRQGLRLGELKKMYSMGNLQWADVAHYYKYTAHEVLVSHHGSQPIRRMSLEGEDLSQYYRRPDLVKDSFVTVPILRHYQDMTEAECIDYTEFVWNDVEFSKVNRSQKISVVWAKDSVGLREMYRQCLFAVRQKGIMWPFFPKDINQLGFHWLVSRGFDVFALIESGQAIRKEVSIG